VWWESMIFACTLLNPSLRRSLKAFNSNGHIVGSTMDDFDTIVLSWVHQTFFFALLKIILVHQIYALHVVFKNYNQCLDSII
jgi:hypothetical protein